MRSVNHPKLVVFKTGQIDMTPPVQANEAIVAMARNLVWLSWFKSIRIPGINQNS
jgi:hypothetical protein